MGGKRGAPRFRSRRRTLRAVLRPAVAAGLAGVLVAGGGAHAAPAPTPGYGALAGGEASGLTISDALPPRGEAPHPTWPAHPPAAAGDSPVASTIRRVALGVPGLSAWIARSAAGGVC